MGILDNAIREHLDLKRKHGARDAELREIEDEAFGSAEQPDPFVASELLTEVGAGRPAEVGDEEPTRLVEAEAVGTQEPMSAPEPETTDESIGTTEPPSPLPGQPELPGADEIPGQERLDEPESYQPSTEPESTPPTDEPESYQPSAEPESMAQTDEPEPSESLEELIAEEEPFPEDSAAPPHPTSMPAEEEPETESRPLEPEPDAEAPADPEDYVPEPPPPPPEPGSEPPGRARGRVDVPTQEHPPPVDTGGIPALPDSDAELGRPDTSYEPPPLDEPPSDEESLPVENQTAGAGGPELYDFETDEDSIPSQSDRAAIDDDFEALGPAEEEAPYLDEEEPYPEEEAYEGSSPDPDERREEEEGEEGLWFEKGPPKDFDFDD
jgi:hypothetical protein